MIDQLSDDWDLFASLVRGAADRDPTAVRFNEPAFTRAWVATQAMSDRSSIDIAVLIRQVLRYQSMRSESTEPARLLVPFRDHWPSKSDWATVGVIANETRDHAIIRAQPWCPSWLPNVGVDGVDAAGMAAYPRRPRHRVAGDPFLTRLNLNEYQSPGQRTAIRAGLTTPPGATLLVCLPTGEGKSLVFHTVADIGFGDASTDSGVVLVVTPTVALALDHERSSRELGMPDTPRAYRSGNVESNREIAERISTGTQGLCFASPEAVCGPLHRHLRKAARSGYLRALVIDEAHLVDAWGTDFRPEFQILSGVRRELLEETEFGPRFRTLLLSATVTEETAVTLRQLFSDGDASLFKICAANRLRPEIDYWVSDLCSQDDQEERTRDAILHLPRPAILYVTEVAKAEWWYASLREVGFNRLACVTGTTSGEVRQSIVERWRHRDLDLVVATSAFGLGIDNPDVRAVIHACVPETLDRFYQEVGRGGRDGRASVSLIIPTYEDRLTGHSLNKKRLITVKRGLERWESMFRHTSQIGHGHGVYAVRLDVPPGVTQRDLDMVGDQNTQWNARTMALLANAGVIALGAIANTNVHLDQDSASVSPDNVEWHPSQVVTILNQRHLEEKLWDERVEPERRRIMTAARANFRRMDRFLNQVECASDTLAPLYQIQIDDLHIAIGVAKACGGCPFCRALGRQPSCEPAPEPRPPWMGSAPTQRLMDILDSNCRLVVFCPQDLFDIYGDVRSRDLARFRNTLREVIRCGVRNVILLPGLRLDLVALQRDVGLTPVFASDQLVPDTLPDGPTIVVTGPTEGISRWEPMRQHPPNHARVYFAPISYPDPVRGYGPLRDVYSGRRLSLDELRDWLEL